MKHFFLVILFLSICRVSYSQDRMDIMKDSVLNEGYHLYYLERASWLTTDLIREYCPNKMNTVKGYLSYPLDGSFKCIFWTIKDTSITFSVTFDSSFEISRAVMDTAVSAPTQIEWQLIRIREAAILDFLSDTSGFYKTYKNTTLNFIPLLEENDKRVLIMTGADIDGFIPFGNDYVLWFGETNNIIKKQKLHNSLIQTELRPETGKPNQVVMATMHSHKLFEIITSTDVCNLLLYQSGATWSNIISFQILM